MLPVLPVMLREGLRRIRSTVPRPIAPQISATCFRFHAGHALPDISDEEATGIMHLELGLGLSPRKIQKPIAKSRITDLRNGGQHSYVSAHRLFWVTRELQAVAKNQPTLVTNSNKGAVSERWKQGAHSRAPLLGLGLF